MSRVVLITGCSSGFGYGMALKFARSGDIVYAAVRTLESVGPKKLVKHIHEIGTNLHVIKLDVTEQSLIDSCVTSIIRNEGRIDILINNAGYGMVGPVEDIPEKEIRRLFNTNVFGLVNMSKAVLPHMRKQKSGLIINVSSVSALVSFPLFSVYAATKSAVEAITEGMRFEVAPFGVKIVLIEPGSFQTNFANNRYQPPSMESANSPYKVLITLFKSRYKKTHSTSKTISKVADSSEVVNSVYTISLKKKPKLRYRIGMDAHKNYFIRNILSDRIWELLMKRLYKW